MSARISENQVTLFLFRRLELPSFIHLHSISKLIIPTKIYQQKLSPSEENLKMGLRKFMFFGVAFATWRRFDFFESAATAN